MREISKSSTKIFSGTVATTTKKKLVEHVNATVSLSAASGFSLVEIFPLDLNCFK